MKFWCNLSKNWKPSEIRSEPRKLEEFVLNVRARDSLLLKRKHAPYVYKRTPCVVDFCANCTQIYIHQTRCNKKTHTYMRTQTLRALHWTSTHTHLSKLACATKNWCRYIKEKRARQFAYVCVYMSNTTLCLCIYVCVSRQCRRC